MLKFAIAVVASAALCISAHAQTFPSFISGAEYLKLPRAERVAYIKGLHDMMSRMCIEVSALDSSSDAAIFCRRAKNCTDDMNADELTDFVESFMAERPDAKQAGMSSVYRAALNVKCPTLIS